MTGQKIRSGGFTIIEVMVAMAMTSVLLLGTATLFSSSHRGGQVQTTVSDLSATGRFALDVLGRDLRMAGYPTGTATGRSVRSTTYWNPTRERPRSAAIR